MISTEDFLYVVDEALVIHVYEELARHRGQMEVTRDVLVARG